MQQAHWVRLVEAQPPDVTVAGKQEVGGTVGGREGGRGDIHTVHDTIAWLDFTFIG